MKTLQIFLLFAILFSGAALSSGVFAQELSQGITIDSATAALQFQIKIPTLLPNNPFYFLKEIGRGIQSIFTFDKIKQAELNERFSNEKLVELQKLIENNVSQSTIDKSADLYKKAVEKSENYLAQIKDEITGNPNLNGLLEKFTIQQPVQEQVIKKVEGIIPQQTAQNIKGLMTEKIRTIDSLRNCPLIAQPAPTFCLNGEIKPKNSSIGCITSYECSTNSNNDSEEVCVPTCLNIGTGVEGWYNSCDKELIKYGSCKNCRAICKNIGTTLEGQYNSCTGELIKWTTCSQKPEVCTQEVNPVCGKNKKTYNNECLLKNAGEELDYKGGCKAECAKDGDCPTIYCIKAPCPKNRCLSEKCRLTECVKDSDCLRDGPIDTVKVCSNYKCISTNASPAPGTINNGNSAANNNLLEPEEGSSYEEVPFVDTGARE